MPSRAMVSPTCCLPMSHDPRSRLSGVRAADRSRRSGDRARGAAGCDPVHLRRHRARAGFQSARLMRAKAGGADVRMIYSMEDALRLARQSGARSGVSRHRLRDHHTADRRGDPGAAEGLKNFSILCDHVLTPPAMAEILAVEGGRSTSTASSGRRMSPPSSAASRMNRSPRLRPAGGHRRFRAAGCDAGHPDAGASDQ